MASDISLFNGSFFHHSSEFPLSHTDLQPFPESSFNFPSIFETISINPFQPQPSFTHPSIFFTTPNPLLSSTSVSATGKGIGDLGVMNNMRLTPQYTDYSRPNGLSVLNDGYMQSNVNPGFSSQTQPSSLLRSSNFDTRVPDFTENQRFEANLQRSNTVEDDSCYRRLQHSALYIGNAPAFRVEPYNREERKERIHIYRSKRCKRNFNKVIKYECRKAQAESRARVHGKFARESVEIPKFAMVHQLEDGGENLLVDELQDEGGLHSILQSFAQWKTPQLRF